jgi:organic hydroperoxide reductase OsmC/OhrA
MADAGVNIETLYSDHNHQLILVVDDFAKGKIVSEDWTREQKEREKAAKQHIYNIDIEWAGNDGRGTETYTSYRRDFNLTAAGKPTLLGSSDPGFRGDPSRYSPEELLIASLSGCHMLWYLHLCSVHHVTIIDYRDNVSATLQENQDGSGLFTEVTLRPRIKLSPSSDRAKAISLHQEAHRFCFIANSVNFAVRIEPEIAN